MLRSLNLVFFSCFHKLKSGFNSLNCEQYVSECTDAMESSLGIKMLSVINREIVNVNLKSAFIAFAAL